MKAVTKALPMAVSRSLLPRALGARRYASRTDNMPFKEGKEADQTPKWSSGEKSDKSWKSTPQSSTDPNRAAGAGWDTADKRAKGESLYSGHNAGIDSAHTQSGSSLRSAAAADRNNLETKNWGASKDNASQAGGSKKSSTDTNRNNLQTQRNYSTKSHMSLRFISQAGMDKTEEFAAGSDRKWQDSNKKDEFSGKSDQSMSSRSDQKWRASSRDLNKDQAQNQAKSRSSSGVGFSSADLRADDLAQGKMATTQPSGKGLGTSDKTSEQRNSEGLSREGSQLGLGSTAPRGEELLQGNALATNNREEYAKDRLSEKTKDTRLS